MYDVIFKNGNVVDVKNEQILQADIAVKDGKIAGIGHFSGENVIDCTGKYITPGFIDAHVHIESSMADTNGIFQSSYAAWYNDGYRRSP